jgi:pimeloyl-ACP methyl ester carboxylesterase
MHAAWSGREWLSGSSTLALAGHSYGALLAGRLAVALPCTAYVSIGAGWDDYEGGPAASPVASLPVPSLFLYGTADYHAAQPIWNVVPTPTHRVILQDGTHWDHVDSSATTCGEANGPCGLVDALTADLTAVFLSKEMRVAGIADSLKPPSFTLSGEQIFYAGNHLTSFDLLPQAGCGVTIEWSTPAAGSVTLPWP